MKNPMRAYRLDCWLGALGAALMLVGDLCLSVIPAGGSDSGLFLREAYLSGNYPAWRLPLLLATGLTGMALGFFTVRASYMQIKPQYRRTRLAVLIGGVIYLSSAGALHLLICSLADWTSTLAPLLGRMETAELIQAQYDRVMPAMLPADWKHGLCRVHKKDHPAPADARVSPARLAARFRADPRYPAAMRRGDFHLGFRSEPGLRQRGAVRLDVCKRALGGAAVEERGECVK